MALVLRIHVPIDELLPLDALLSALRDALGREVEVDEESRSRRGEESRESSWCPWPRARLGLYVPGQTTRGTDLTVELRGSWLRVECAHPSLGTWTDFRVAVEVASAIADACGTDVELVDGQRLAPEDARAFFLDEPARWESLVERATEQLRVTVVEEQKVVRLSGPAGTAWIGPRTWSGIVAEGPAQELPARVLDRIQGSVDGRGWEGFYAAQPIVLDGRSGRDAVACLLPPDQATIVRDPEFVLISEDLEAVGGGLMWLLPFTEVERALPGLVTWIDERTAAIGAIPRASWAARIEHARVHLVSMRDFLDGPEPAQDRGQVTLSGGHPAADLDDGTPGRPWWRFWG